jgi:hypothetical protein
MLRALVPSLDLELDHATAHFLGNHKSMLKQYLADPSASLLRYNEQLVEPRHSSPMFQRPRVRQSR